MQQMTEHARKYITRFCGYIDVEGSDLVVRMPFPDDDAAERAMKNTLQLSTC